MLYEFAVEPAALARWGPLWQALEQFGVSHGRLISKFPKNWEKTVYEATENCAPVERAALEVRLRALKSKLVPSGRPYDDKRNWRLNAEPQRGLLPFHAVIQSDNLEKAAHVLTEQDLHAGEPRWNVLTQRCVARNPDELAACAVALFIVSRQLLFIDPYFSGKRKFTAVFGAFMQNAHANGRKYNRIEIHTGESGPFELLKKDAETWIKPLVPRGVVVTVLRWKERPGGEKFHARYVLTDRGGIRFDVGLDAGEPGQTTDVALLSEDLYAQRWKNFQKESSAYDLDGEFTIVGTGQLVAPPSAIQ